MEFSDVFVFCDRVSCVICTVRGTEKESHSGLDLRVLVWGLRLLLIQRWTTVDIVTKCTHTQTHANIGILRWTLACSGENTWAWLLLCEMAVKQAGRRCLHPRLPLGDASVNKIWTASNKEVAKQSSSSQEHWHFFRDQWKSWRGSCGGTFHGLRLAFSAITRDLRPNQRLVYCLP